MSYNDVMNFKIHILVILVIVAVLFVARSFVTYAPSTPQVIVQAPAESAYSISIAHASWGLNCPVSPRGVGGQNGMYETVDYSKIKEDNVLSVVSNLCNGNSKCDVAVNINPLGDDPLPSCGSKILQIDYRCFSVDKLRTAVASSGVVSIDCDKQLKE
jgi:hypothetical protein